MGPQPGFSRKLSQVATVRQLPSGGFSVQVNEPELALIKTALQQTEQLS
jgi:hypothetical protein